MNKTKLFLLALAGLFAVSCATNPVDETAVVDANAMTAKKFVNTSNEANEGELIIYVDEIVAEMLTGAECATRSGSPIDAVVAEIGATSIKPVFNLNVNGDVKRARGMHRWFTVTFPETVALEAAAERLAAVKEVSRIQFATAIVRPEATAVEADPSQCAQTRSDEMPFDDPMLYKQWHYRNLGLQEIHPQAKAGADVNVFPAWEITKGRNDIIVAVVDEGVCYEHEDLVDNMWINEAEENGVEGVDDDNNG